MRAHTTGLCSICTLQYEHIVQQPKLDVLALPRTYSMSDLRQDTVIADRLVAFYLEGWAA